MENKDCFQLITASKEAEGPSLSHTYIHTYFLCSLRWVLTVKDYQLWSEVHHARVVLLSSPLSIPLFL